MYPSRLSVYRLQLIANEIRKIRNCKFENEQNLEKFAQPQVFISDNLSRAKLGYTVGLFFLSPLSPWILN